MTTPTASLSVLLTSSESTDTSSTMVWLFWIATAVAISPLVARATRGLVPDVVSLLVLGALIGPGVLGLASTGSGIDLLSELGLGLLFLIAGTEIQPATLRAAQGRQAAATWILCMLLGFSVAWVFIPVADFSVALVLALAISSTALGALTPILRDIGLESTPLGRAVVTHGVMGELGPILVIAVLLGSRASLTTVAVLLGFALLAVLVAIAPRALLLRIPGVSRAIVQGMHGTGQTGMRFIFWLLLSLMAAAAVLDLDLVIGAFAAGFVLRAIAPDDAHFLDEKLTVVAWSFLVPVFFLTTGMDVDVAAVATSPGLLTVFVLMILGVRGGVVLLREQFTPTASELTTATERVQLGLYAAAGLPIIVAVTEVAVEGDLMPGHVASVLVAAGIISVTLFPALAQGLPHVASARSRQHLRRMRRSRRP
ncbi:cation:proton antiporter [Aeromicrobium sp. Sec7.5]|uniref:cation:proton antiporter n=1 Tax=Aeromicrobium sp. Sec7.5 TaxID=3121276 RepID=UPI002FE484EF